MSRNAYRTLSPVFVDLILNDQNLFATDEGFESFLKLIPDEEVAEQLREEKVSGSSSKEVWDRFTGKVKSCRDKQKVSHPMMLCCIILRCPSCSQSVLSAAWHDIQIYYTYPRLDAEVSKHRNHLLKAPFCVHPKTGRVCVPIDPEKIDDFDPEMVPSVTQLLHELDALDPTATTTDSTSGEYHPGWLDTLFVFNHH